MSGDGNVVVPDHGHVLRHSEPALLQLIDHSDRMKIIMCDDRGGCVEIDGCELSSRQCLFESELSPFAGLLSEVLRRKGKPAMTERVEMIDRRLHGC
jgi:hypothetical protein